MYKESRINILDSVRGLAALTVLFNHILQTFPVFDAPYAGTFFDNYNSPTWISKLAFLLSYTPLHLFWGGHEAVILFFVLSGFVLSLSFMGDKTAQPYKAYLIKRIFRIYVPYIAVIAVSGVIVSLLTVRSIVGLSDFFNVFWAHPIDWKRIVDHILMLGLTTADIDGVTWTLVHEMRISVVFPLLMLIVSKRSWATSLAAAIAVSIAATALQKVLPLYVNVYGTMHYIAFFILGAVLAKYRSRLGTLYASLGPASRLALLVATIFFLNWRWEFSTIPYLNNFRITEWVIAVGAAMVLLISMNSRIARGFLSLRPILWLGKISYSLYLVHLVILLTCVHLLYNTLAMPLIMALVPIFSLTAAAATYKWIELPAKTWGKRLASAVTTKEPQSAELVRRVM